MGKLKRINPTEHQEQVAFFDRVNRELLPKFPECKWLYAIPNQGGSGWNGKSRGISMVAEGLKKGVNDICLPVPRYVDRYSSYIFCGLYIEMKKRPEVSPVKGRIRYHRPTPEQREFMDFVIQNKYAAECCNGQDEAFFALEWYLNLQKLFDCGVDYESVIEKLRSFEYGPK